MWIVFHAIFWDGNAANKEDIIDSLLSPGNTITNLGTCQHDKVQDILPINHSPSQLLLTELCLTF